MLSGNAPLLSQVIPCGQRVAISAFLAGLPRAAAITAVIEDEHAESKGMECADDVDAVADVAAVPMEVQQCPPAGGGGNEPAVQRFAIPGPDFQRFERQARILRGGIDLAGRQIGKVDIVFLKYVKVQR